MTATEPTKTTTGVPFTLNGTEFEAENGELLIDACERNGVHIPRFCYHPRMTPVGMCRMCLVEVDTGRGPALQPSCMLPVTPEMKVETESEATRKAQDGVLEFLLANHPLDCPVCDKGGECPLQDNAYAFGPGETRFVEEKRHYEKPIPISDLVHLDRERCILCDRCTRFASEVAGDPLIHFIDRGSQTQVNTFPDDPFSSYFSGNTVQICPVGALTAAPYRFKARPWDLDAVASTSTVDATGARVVLQASQNELVRIVGVDSDAVNWGWLSDKDRFIYEANTSEARVTEPLLATGAGGGENGEKNHRPTRWSEAVKTAARSLRIEPEKVALLGGARLSLESQYAWTKLIKGIVGSDHVDAQLGDGVPAALALGLDRASIAEVCRPGGVIVVIGPDPKEELPTLYLRLRHAVLQDGATLVEVGPRRTSLSDFATLGIRTQPGTVGQVMAAVADGRLDEAVGSVDRQQLQALRSILTGGRPVTVLFGRANLAESARYVADAVGALRSLVPEISFLPLLRRGNIHGALEMGMTPGFLPGGVRNRRRSMVNWPSSPDFEGKDTDGILRAAAAGEIETLVLLGADPLADFPDADLARDALAGVETIIAVDSFMTASARQAKVFLPAAMAGEYDGSFLNVERRLSPLRAKVTAPGLSRPDWMIAAELSSAVGPELGFASLDELRAEMSESVVVLADLDWSALATADDGPVLGVERNWDLEFGDPAALPPVSSYGFRLVVDRKLWDNGTMVQNSPSLAHLTEPAVLRLSPADVRLMDLDDATHINVDQGDAEFDLPFVADPAVAPRTAWLPIGLSGFDVRQLLAAGRSITNVRLRPSEVRGDTQPEVPASGSTAEP
ncbi:MAG: NADH-quinone oxidoreductase subunit NuoG, partial [Acidimicrobiia bacterium]|nr:NADH-quinone oxidoreductase subunit NuoG [Acidimicrobiia bacterium]